MYYPSYPYGTYSMSNMHNFHPVSSQIQYTPEKQAPIPQKETTSKEGIITNEELVSKEELTFGELLSKEGPIFGEESTSKKGPIFTKRLLNHLYQRRGKTIFVATPIKEIQGRLEKVFPDYILVNHEGQHYHIRLEGIIYIS
ncbi:hypothetical protein D1872_186250 [compost metagenome]